MKFKNILIPLLALGLVACNDPSSASTSASNSTPKPNSTSTSTSKPSTGTSTSASSSASNTPVGTSINVQIDNIKDSLPTESNGNETLINYATVSLGFVSCNYGTYNNAGFLMMRKTSDTNGAGHLYNTQSLGAITSVVVKFSSSTSANAILGASFGKEKLSSAITEAKVTEQAAADKVVTFTNTDPDCGFFNLSVTNNYNCQIVELVINLNGGTGTIA